MKNITKNNMLSYYKFTSSEMLIKDLIDNDDICATIARLYAFFIKAFSEQSNEIVSNVKSKNECNCADMKHLLKSVTEDNFIELYEDMLINLLPNGYSLQDVCRTLLNSMDKASAEVVLGSSNPQGNTLLTFQLVAPQIIQPQLIRHRAFSFSIISQRAISAEKNASLGVFVPSDVRYNQSGMQGKRRVLGDDYNTFFDWYADMYENINEHISNCFVDVHKQTINRLLQPFGYFQAIVSTTGSGLMNFFDLRLRDDVQPEMNRLARMMARAVELAEITKLKYGEWHIPYISPDESELDIETRLAISATRCARISYGFYQDSKFKTIDKEVTFAKKLLDSRHMSPFEHQAVAIEQFTGEYDMLKRIYKNFEGFRQQRSILEK